MSGMTYAPADGLDISLGSDGILRLILNRPAKRNALDDGMVAGLIGAVEQAGQDEAGRAISITGSGDHFCGGVRILAPHAAARGGPAPARGAPSPPAPPEPPAPPHPCP